MVVAIRVARLERNFRRSYPWIVIAASALGWGALVASGRLGRGIGAATASRYAVNVVYFYIGVAGVAGRLYDVWGGTGPPKRGRPGFALQVCKRLFFVRVGCAL